MTGSSVPCMLRSHLMLPSTGGCADCRSFAIMSQVNLRPSSGFCPLSGALSLLCLIKTGYGCSPEAEEIDYPRSLRRNGRPAHRATSAFPHQNKYPQISSNAEDSILSVPHRPPGIV